MKIYERPVCECCKIELAMCRYANAWVCGRCLEKIVNKENEKKKEIFKEVMITG